jgi:hypothetical protein
MAVFVGGAAFLTVEFTSYVIMRTMDDTLVKVPEGYGFTHWLREPIGLKWAIISKVPMVRYLPFVFALCAAGFLQTLLLELRTNFRMATFIFLVQWVLTIVIMGVVSVGVNFALRTLVRPPEQAVAGAPGQPPPPAAPEAGSSSLAPKDKMEEVKVTAGQFWDKLHTVVDPYLAEVKEALAPVTRHLPESVQHFLDAGGWWPVLAVAGLLALLWLRTTLRAVRRLFRPKRRKKKRRTVRVGMDLREDISELAAVYTDDPPDRVTVKGVPARLRLVVLSEASRTGQGVSEDMLDPLFDWIYPGLAAIVGPDYPRERLWPPYHSADGFDLAFAQNVSIPGGGRGQRTRWVLVSGRVEVGRQKINVGLAFYADKPTNLGHLKVRSGGWLDVLGVQQAVAGARG